MQQHYLVLVFRHLVQKTTLADLWLLTVVGVTLGGGIGRYQGLDGLLADALLSASLVTANGELITVSEDSYPDLFWAIRGAGQNFGIITSATYRLSPLTNSGMVFNADIILPAASNASYFDALQALQDNMPAELATITILTYNAASAQVSDFDFEKKDQH
jgi:FAD/FMN-containing dehydrogenase